MSNTQRSGKTEKARIRHGPRTARRPTRRTRIERADRRPRGTTVLTAALRHRHTPRKGYMFEHRAEGHAVLNTHCLRTAQAKWERLTQADYARITTVPELIAAVAQRYSLPCEQARRDVERWAKDMRL